MVLLLRKTGDMMNSQQITGGMQEMFKKYKLIIALLIVGLVGSSFGQTVEASASAGDGVKERENNRYTFEVKVDKNNFSSLEQFFKDCFAQWNVKWNDKGWKQPSKPNKDEVEQPVEQTPEEEQAPEQEVEQP